jgi:hypothetical protein
MRVVFLVLILSGVVSGAAFAQTEGTPRVIASPSPDAGVVKDQADSSEPQAREIIQKTVANYQGMASYSSEGKIEDVMMMGETTHTFTKTISIKLERPGRYKVTWQGKGVGSQQETGAVWNAGDGAKMSIMGVEYQKYSDDKMALSAATGVSGGAARTIPALFLNIGMDPFEQIKNLKVAGSETVEGQECYILSGESLLSTKARFWITKDKYLIVRNSYTMDKKPQLPNFSDDQMNESIKAMGLEVNPENKAKVKQMMEMAASAMKTAKLDGSTHQEDYTNIGVNAAIAPQEFNYEVSPGALGTGMKNVLDHLDGMNYSMIATQGASLSAEEAAALEASLAGKPDDFETRIKLLGYYFSKHTPEARAEKKRHIVWIVRNKPDFLGGDLIWPQVMLHPAIDGDAYDQVKQLWLEQVQKHPDNALVLRNASGYLQINDKALSKEFLERANKIDPK